VAIEVSSKALTAASPEVAFDAVVPIDLTKHFTGYGPIPQIVGIEDQTGDWDTAGQTRRINLKDGTHVLETIEVCDRPGYFEYKVGPFSGFNRHVMSHAKGQFWFDGDESGTLIRWTYTWHPQNVFVLPLAWVLTRVWKRYSEKLIVEFADAADAAVN
jgi:hypothetical protein